MFKLFRYLIFPFFLFLNFSILVKSDAQTSIIKKYFNERYIKIDCLVEKQKPVVIEDLALWFTKDNGKTWQKSSARYQKDRYGYYFEYYPVEDGEYGFKVAGTTSISIKTAPPKPGEKPTNVVVVDTTPPLIEMKILPDKKSYIPGETITLKWKIKDANLSPHPATLDIAEGEKRIWIHKASNLASQGKLDIKLPDKQLSSFLFRIHAKDLADNLAKNTLGIVIQKEKKSTTPPTQKISPPKTTPSHPPTTLQDSILKKSNIVNIEYNLKKKPVSGIQEIVLWYTRDGGSTWTKYGNDPDLLSPFIFKAPEDGLYGFYLVVISQAGKSSRPVPPSPGTQPDKTVLVDTIPPVVTMLFPVDEESLDSGKSYTLKWFAKDPFLAQKPISLYYSIDDGKNWSTIVENIDNTGEYVWTPPSTDTSFLRIKIVAKDAAGNIGSAVNPYPIKVENTPAEIVILRIEQGEEGVSKTVIPSDKNSIRPTSLASNKNKAEKHFNLGTYYLVQKQLYEALREFKTVIKYNPAHGKAYNEIGIVYYQLGDYQNALDNLKKAKEIAGMNKSILYNLAFVMAKCGDTANAVQEALYVLKISPPSSYEFKKGLTLLWNISLQHLALNEKNKAKEIWQKLSTIAPESNPYFEKAKQYLQKY